MTSDLLTTNKNEIHIVKGKTTEGLFWIIVYQYGKAEFRYQDIEIWISEDLGIFLEENVKDLTLEEIRSVLKSC